MNFEEAYNPTPIDTPESLNNFPKDSFDKPKVTQNLLTNPKTQNINFPGFSNELKTIKDNATENKNILQNTRNQFDDLLVNVTGQTIEQKKAYLSWFQGMSQNDINILPEHILDGMYMKEVKEFADIVKNLKRQGIEFNSYQEFKEQTEKNYGYIYQNNESLSGQNEANNEKNSYIENLKIPENFRSILGKMLQKLGPNEILKPGDPIALVDAATKQMCYITFGASRTFPIIIGKGGTARSYENGDKKTIIGEIHRFDPYISKLASSPDGDASNGGSKTVKSASLQSALSASTGGRYFHGVELYRIPNGGTWGCVGVDPQTIRQMYADVVRNGKGYGYVDYA